MEQGAEMKGMQKYCINCPKFKIVFDRKTLDDYDQPVISGRIFGICWDYYMFTCFPPGTDVKATIASKDFGRKICQKDDLKYGYDCIYDNGRIPDSLKEQVEKYVATHECPWTKELMEREDEHYCPFWMERSIEEWNQ
jgi:hypothetical protein